LDRVAGIAFGRATNMERYEIFQTQAMIQAGETHNIFLDRDGTVWAWGYNGDGELGNGNWSDSSILMQVVGLSNIVAVAVSEGGYFSLALDANGIVWSWGANWSDQLGRNNGLIKMEIPLHLWLVEQYCCDSCW